MAGQLVELVDVSTRTDDADIAIFLGISAEVFLKQFLRLSRHLPTQHSQRTHVVGETFSQCTVVDDGNLSASTAHVDIGEVSLIGVGLLHQVVVEQLRLLLSFDNLEFDAGLLFYFLQHLLAVFSISHGRSGTGTEGIHIVEFHELLESLHHVEHQLLPFLGNLAEGKHILTQAQRNADKHDFLDAVFLAWCFRIKSLDE